MRLTDTTIVVTGAGHGLGRAMAAGFVREGAAVAGVDLDESALDAVRHGVDNAERFRPVTANVRSVEAVQSAVATVRRTFGPVDVLVNNAGVKQLTVTGDERPAWEVPPPVWDTVLETNLRAPYLCSRAVLPAMVDRGEGLVIHVTSGHGQSARVRRAPYVASKFGLEGFHRTLARDLDGTGVASVAFTPPGGGVRTREAEFVADPSSMSHDTDVVVEPAVQLAAGAGRNGGRYQATADGDGVVLTDDELG